MHLGLAFDLFETLGSGVRNRGMIPSHLESFGGVIGLFLGPDVVSGDPDAVCRVACTASTTASTPS